MQARQRTGYSALTCVSLLGMSKLRLRARSVRDTSPCVISSASCNRPQETIAVECALLQTPEIRKGKSHEGLQLQSAEPAAGL